MTGSAIGVVRINGAVLRKSASRAIAHSMANRGCDVASCSHRSRRPRKTKIVSSKPYNSRNRRKDSRHVASVLLRTALSLITAVRNCWYVAGRGHAAKSNRSSLSMIVRLPCVPIVSLTKPYASAGLGAIRFIGCRRGYCSLDAKDNLWRIDVTPVIVAHLPRCGWLRRTGDTR